ncbi:MAG: hypothetical protein IPJ71_02175 [Bdellovibrionales bacterium]|nr:hypothetical protein [Bdellovibrionales bacterium]
MIQISIFRISLSLLVTAILTSCLNVDNDISGNMGFSPIQIEIPSNTDLNADLKMVISGGSPPYQVDILEGRGSFDVNTNSFFPQTAGRIRLQITDSKNKKSELIFNVSLGKVIEKQVSNYEFDFQSGLLFFTSNLEDDVRVDLYSRDMESLVTRHLSGTTGAGLGTVADFKLSPGGNKLVYRADHELSGLRQLYSVDINGSNLVKLNHTEHYVYNSMVYSQGVQSDYQIANSGRVIYRDGNHNRFADNEMRVQGVNLDGGLWGYVSAELIGGADRSAEGFSLSPDGAWAVASLMWWENWYKQAFAFRTDGSTTAMTNRLHMVPPNAMARYDDMAGGGVSFSPDSNWVFTPVVYDSTIPTDMYRLYSTHLSVDPTTPILLGKNYHLGAVSNDSTKIAVRKAEKVGFVYSQVDLLLLSPDGSWSYPLLEPVTKYFFTPDSSHLIFVRPSTKRLYSISVDGTGEVPLSGVHAGPDGTISSFYSSADSSQVLYWSSEENGTDFYLYKASVDGSLREKMSETKSPKAPIKFLINDQRAYCFFTVDVNSDGKADEFHILNLSTGKVQKLSGVLASDAYIDNFYVHPSQKKIYFATKGAVGGYDLYLATLDY